MRSQLITLAVIVVCCGLMLINERPLVPEVDRLQFTLLKGASILAFAFTAFLVWWRPNHALNNWAYAASSIGYTVVSSLWRSFYVLCVFEMILVFAFIFPHRPRFFWGYMLSAMFIFTGVLAYRYPDVPEEYLRPTLTDWINFSGQLVAMLAIFYVFFVRARRARQKSEAQLMSLGRQSARISHDLKNMMAAPQIYLEHLAGALHTHAELAPAVAAIRTQMVTMQTALAELSRLAAPNGLPESSFSIRDSINAAAIALGSSLRSISVEIEGEFDCVADRSLVSPIIYNLMANAIAAINLTKPPERWIRWTLDHGSVICEDSGGGFSSAALARACQGVAHSEFEGGTGLGLEIVRDNVRRLGCTIGFANGVHGARVHWRW